MIYDVLIIGAGVTGAMLARSLARYELKTAVLEKSNDVGNGTSNANSAIIHSGYDPVPGTLKGKFNVLANPMFDQIADELDVPFFRIGSLTVAMDEKQMAMLPELEKRSHENGVPTRIVDIEELRKMEPNISPEAKGALFAPTAGIIDPFNLVVHAMENAVDNGVELFLENEVKSIKKEDIIFLVTTDKAVYKARVVVDAAGVHAAEIASMYAPVDWKITPRKGEYYVLDHFAYGFVNHTLFPLPSEKGKGILVSPTASFNYIVGPSSEPVVDGDDVSTDAPTLNRVYEEASRMVPALKGLRKEIIRTFSGNRPTSTRHDFIIEPLKDDDHFILLAGIESPGLVSSPAIAEYVLSELIAPLFPLTPKKNYNPRVKRYHPLYPLSEEERNLLVSENPEYGQIVCNCEQISLAHIKDVLSRSIPPRSVKGMKRRVRAGYGKCQGGFCQPKVLLLMAEHYGVSPTMIPYDEPGSEILTGTIGEETR